MGCGWTVFRVLCFSLQSARSAPAGNAELTWLQKIHRGAEVTHRGRLHFTQRWRALPEATQLGWWSPALPNPSYPRAGGQALPLTRPLPFSYHIYTVNSSLTVHGYLLPQSPSPSPPSGGGWSPCLNHCSHESQHGRHVGRPESCTQLGNGVHPSGLPGKMTRML